MAEDLTLKIRTEVDTAGVRDGLAEAQRQADANPLRLGGAAGSFAGESRSPLAPGVVTVNPAAYSRLPSESIPIISAAAGPAWQIDTRPAAAGGGIFAHAPAVGAGVARGVGGPDPYGLAGEPSPSRSVALASRAQSYALASTLPDWAARREAENFEGPDVDLSDVEALGRPAEVDPGTGRPGGRRGGGGGFGGGFGRHFGAFALIHTGATVLNAEEAYRRARFAAGADPEAQAEADVRRRTSYDSLFFGVGRLGRYVRESVLTDGGDSEDLLESLETTRDADRLAGTVRENIAGRRSAGAVREAVAQGSYPGAIAEAAARRDAAIRRERDRELDATRQAGAFHQEDTYEYRAGGLLGYSTYQKGVFDLPEAKRSALKLTAADARQEQEEARRAYAADAGRLNLGMADMHLGQQADLSVAGLRGGGEDLRAAIEARRNRGFAEARGLRGDDVGATNAVRLANADISALLLASGRQTDLANLGNAHAALIAGTVESTSGLTAGLALAGDVSGAGLSRIRGDRDTSLQRLKFEREEALAAITDPDERAKRAGGINARFDAQESLVRQQAADREAAFSQGFADQRASRFAGLQDRVAETGLLAEGRDKTARVRSIEDEVNLATMNLRGPDAAEQTRLIRQAGINELQANLRNLQLQGLQGGGQAVASGATVGPGFTEQRPGEEPLEQAIRENTQAIQRATDQQKGQEAFDGGSGSDF